MVASTKEEVYGYLERISRGFLTSDLKRFTANDISEALNISRNLASQYLNELVKEKRALKVNSRPVYFFHRRNVELDSQVQFDTCVFSGMDEFLIKRREKSRRQDFQKAIGCCLSLGACIEQCKAAVHYPPNGLPVLLVGEPGTGKAFLSRLMFEYGKNQKAIRKEGRYIAVDCREYRENERGILKGLYGEGEEKGWIVKAAGGMIFFDGIDSLPPSGQEAILAYLEAGNHSPALAQEAAIPEARLVFATSKQPEEALFKALARRIPIVVPVPSLRDRTIDEKEEMLVAFLRREGKRMGVEVSVSKQAFCCMMEFPFENNIGQLKACVTSCCAGAYLEKQDDRIRIQAYHLPDAVLEGLKLHTEFQDGKMIDMSSYSKDDSSGQALEYFQMMLEEYAAYRKGRQAFFAMLARVEQYVNEFYDYLIYGQKLVNVRIRAYEQLIGQIFETVGETCGLSMTKKHSYLAARCLYIQLRGDRLLEGWLKNNSRELEEALAVLSANMAKEAQVAQRIVGLIKENLDLEVNLLNQFLLTINVISRRETLHTSMTAGIILSHGYSTASSIADAANQIVGKRVFEAIDMPLNVKSEEIAAALERQLERCAVCRDVILMVDMGSLEQIHQEMKRLSNMNIGIINNISTALAVDIGMGIHANLDMETILRQACEHNVCTWRIINNAKKEDAVLFSGENGLDMAEKIKELIVKSAGAEVPVRFMAYDYHRLLRNGRRDEVFGNYRVKCIIGLFNPEIQGVPFIALEDIISMRAARQMEQVFGEYLDRDSLELFKKNMLKNFTLQNVVESLTILNPDKLLDEVEQAVLRLSRITGQKIEERIITGLYVHLCCLVERLVTKTPIERYGDLEGFEQENRGFIEQAREAFWDISNHYKVELPVSEIAYMYDYIHLSSKNKRMSQEQADRVWEDE